MAVKLNIDKDQLIKHHFWILLGVCVLLVLIALIMLPSSLGSQVEAVEKAYKSSKDTLQKLTTSTLKNEKWVQAYGVKDQYAAAKVNKLWQEAWELQKDMMTWPETLRQWGNKYPYMGEFIEFEDRDSYPRYYREQLWDIVNIVEPVTNKGTGVVQFKGGYDSILRIERDFSKPPVESADIWLAQEDLWVKRELLRIVRGANDEVAVCKEVEVKPAARPAAADTKAATPLPAHDRNHKLFRNAHWEIDVNLIRDDKGQYVLQSKIKNIGKREQLLGIKFKVYLEDKPREDSAFVVLPVDGEPLAVGESFTNNDRPLEEAKTIQGVFGLEQELTWRTGAVKRIDDIAPGWPSSRTANLKLVPPRWLATLQAKDRQMMGPSGPEAAGPATTAAPATAGPPAGQQPPGAGGGGQQQARATKNGLETELYTDTNDQVRHMPVGMVVILEEEHIPEFLAAFSNSKLRIQILQCHWHHAREKLAPHLAEEAAAGQTSTGGGPMGRMGGMSGLGQGAVVQRPPRPGGMSSGLGGTTRPGGPGGGGNRAPDLSTLFQSPAGKKGGSPQAQPDSQKDKESDEEDMNLVELAVYGLASLYERYPPREVQQAAAPGNTPNPK